MMTYVIWVYGDDDKDTMYSALVPPQHEAYLQRVWATLSPLTEDEYLNGPAAILQTAARSSYVVVEESVLWCIEWDPGFIVVRFSPNGHFSWTAIRSPVPNFGGREAPQSEIDAYDEDTPNPQYNLIFDSWDSQFDEDKRSRKGFAVADSDTESKFNAALFRVNRLQQIVEQMQGDPMWSARCTRNLKSWLGDGIRMT